MIYQSSKGSICFYYKGVLISGYGLTDKKNLDNYLYQGEYLITASKGVDIKKQIRIYTGFCNLIHRKKLNKERITRDDHKFFITCLCALLRLRIIDNDDMNGYLICKRK
tara:strand:- start:12882 stop:13208 length:327 start_codon:yes stop_codon:yes gene_type:complete